MRALWLALTLPVAACGSDGNTTSASPPVTSTATTNTAPLASTTSTTVVATTTTAVPLSREARLAVERCKDSLGPFFSEQVSLKSSYLDVAQAACDEAKVQLAADNPVAGMVASDLAFAVSQVNLALAFAKLAVVSDTFDAEMQASLQRSVDDFDTSVTSLLLK